MQNTGSVLIVDDHPLVRFAIRTLMETNGWHIAAEAESGVDALTLARQHRPDLVILDICIPRMDGLTAIGRLRGDSANTVTKILVLSAQNPQHLAMRCLHAGASGFVYKEKDLQELVTATRAVMQGNTYFPTEAMRPMCHGQGLDDENALISRLSNRELVVLQHLARGALNKTIAAALMLSEKTVSTYKSRLHEKLNTVSVLELTDLARRHGLA